MSNNFPQNIALKCPYCGWSIKFETESLKRIAITDIAKGLEDPIIRIIEKLRQALQNDADPDFFWVDIHQCPNCSSSFQINIASGEVRK